MWFHLPMRKTNFYPRPPRGGRRECIVDIDSTAEFLSTPSARRATHRHHEPRRSDSISIHALREEGDYLSQYYRAKERQFLSTPSARRATKDGTMTIMASKFLSTPSARRATEFIEGLCASDIFLSTPSARRATAKTETKSLFSNKLYNILHEFRRALIYNGSKNYPNHAK